MNQQLLTKICSEINSCQNWKNGDLTCGRDENAIPKTVEIRETQRILLISEAPSNLANELEDVTDYKNEFLRKSVLKIFFMDYDVSKAKSDKTYFERYKEKFLNLVYWTHYQKCFPGIYETSKQHKPPKNICVEKYLTSEIEAFEPELIICMGARATRYITGEKELPVAISNNRKNVYMTSGKEVPVIAITHPSGQNGHKHKPEYKFNETIDSIHDAISSY